MPRHPGSQRRQSATVSFTEPYFLGRDLAAGFDLFQTRTDFESESSFDETSTGGTLRARLSADREPAPLGALHAARRQHPQRRQRRLGLHPGRGGHRLTSLVGQTFSYDRRDDRFLPSGGYFLKLDQDLAGLGGDNRFIRHEARAEYYYSIVPDVVLSAQRQWRLHHRLRRRGRASHQPLLRRRCQPARLPVRRHRPARQRQTDDKLGGNLYYIGLGRAALPAGPAQGAARCSGAPSSMPAR